MALREPSTSNQVCVFGPNYDENTRTWYETLKSNCSDSDANYGHDTKNQKMEV